MDNLKTEDVLALSIFKCKVCYRRLHTPVFQVGVFGNICGTCYASSAYTNAERNAEIETLLLKLYVTCDFAERGCTYEGPYSKTCDHQKICRFRNRKCPLGYEQNCDSEFNNSADIIEHIRNDHVNNVLNVENNCIELENPAELCLKQFYLLQSNDTVILLRTMLKQAKKRVYYIFYHFGIQEVSISLTFGEREVTLTTTSESEICYEFNSRNAFKINLDNRALSGILTFIIRYGMEYCGKPVDTVNKINITCSYCFKNFSENIQYCSECYKIICCSKSCKLTCNCKQSPQLICLSKIKLPISISCDNIDCQEIIPYAIYRVHRTYLCRFRKHGCGTDGCEWTGCFLETVKHRLEKHSLPVNQNIHLCYLSVWFRTYDSYFSNGNDIFFHEYCINRDAVLTITIIKLTEPHWTNSFSWTIKIKTKSGNKNVTITGDYTVTDYIRELDVKEYIYDEQFTLETYIRRN